ncbi:MAG: M16 family metallopeptidase [Candidatus Sumerlaeaceae bacterium]
MARKFTCVLVFVLFSWATLSFTADYRLSDKVKFWKFENGFQVIFLPRENTPFFSAVIYVNVGAVDESVGESGIAHLLEHMAFKGTPWIGTRDWNAEREKLVEIEQLAQEIRALENKHGSDAATTSLFRQFSELQKQSQKYVVPNEYDRLVTLAGGQEVNATTSNDCTNYFMTLPSNKLELWAMLESERLQYPAWREFYKERDVVAEERRMRMEDDPEGRLYEEFIAAAFKAHPYGTPVIGWMSDILNLTVSDMVSFYRRWYVPQNMVAVIVGNVSEEEAREVTKKYFGTLPHRPSPSRLATQEPPQTALREVKLSVDAQPQLVMGWHKPPLPSREATVFEVLQYVLTDNGRSSRLYSELVKKRGLCESVATFTAPGEKYGNLFCIWATPKAPHTPQDVQRAVWEELHKLRENGVTTDELEMTLAKVDTALVQELESNLGCARRVGYFYLITGDPTYLDKYRAEIRRVTSADIQRVVNTYLTRDRATIASVEKTLRTLPPADRDEPEKLDRIKKQQQRVHPERGVHGR